MPLVSIYVLYAQIIKVTSEVILIIMHSSSIEIKKNKYLNMKNNVKHIYTSCHLFKLELL